MPPLYQIIVRVPYELYKDVEHPAVAAAAEKLGVKHDGRYIVNFTFHEDLYYLSSHYEHFYYSMSEASANAFADDVRKLDLVFKPEVGSVDDDEL
jgi:hypothetical protein